MKPEVSRFLLPQPVCHCLLASSAVPMARKSEERHCLRASNTCRRRALASVATILTQSLLLLILTTNSATAEAAEENARLDCTPRTFRVVPGEPMRLELTVRADSAAPVRLHVPGNPMLKLRAIEKLPVRQTPEGTIVRKRVVVWQALEPGLIKIDKLSVETKGQKLLFPEVTITVRDPGP